MSGTILAQMENSSQLPLIPISRSNKRELLVQPFLKWAGGKRQLMPSLRPLIPVKPKRYYEPFLGGGAVLFDLQPSVAIVNDFNAELINCYQIIRDNPQALIEAANAHKNTSEHFYSVREMDRSAKFSLLTPVERAARILYLNKTCFNGLFRVNSQGQFNVPFGDYKNPIAADPAVILAVSKYINAAKITFRIGDFAEAVTDAKKGDFVYFDPPYDPVSDTSSFTGYSLSNFDRTEQQRLKEVCDALTGLGVKVLLSNSNTPFIRELYEGSHYSIQVVQARRNINSVSAGRGKVDELFIMNYTL